MADYDFKSLSSYDFALLARDLLQAELGLRLESFSEGPDSGIDLRYRDGTTNLIVQCKHYAGSGFSALMSILRRKEHQKITRLAPSRYILATSVPLTPNRKDEIIKILMPYCHGPSDVCGCEDLNNLLGRFPNIERQHFKLWLTSEVVLRRVLDAGIFTDSEAHLDRIRLRLCRYVENPSFQRAGMLLDKHHYCIIAGIPGIGKTTLAEVLLADLVERQGFEAFRIAHDLAEIRSIKNSKRKQVFYFDDFLGKTSLEKLQKNEDQRLVELMEEVASNPNWRLILTTREYILNSAKLRYEAFEHPSIDFRLCVVNLADYTRPIRDRILYNHVYFSDLPKPHKLALLKNKGYENILQHRNYNPRVIEYMTTAQHACTVAPSLYLSEFTNSLEHPTRIWDHAFRHQISEAARNLLLVLSTLQDEVLLTDLETAFWTFHQYRQARFGFASSSGDWNDALKQLDGSFVMTNKYGRDLIISFHNPSIRDFLEDFLSSSDGDVGDLINGAHFYEQFTTLWTGRRGHRYRGVDRNHNCFLHEFQKKVFGPSAKIIRVVSGGSPVGFDHANLSNENRALFAVGIADDLKTDAANKFVYTIVNELTRIWEKGIADREDLVKLLEALIKIGLKKEDRVFAAARQCLASSPNEISDHRALAKFLEKYPDQLAQIDISCFKDTFLDFAEEYADGWDDDADWFRQIAEDLESIGAQIGVDVSRVTEDLYDRAYRIEREGENIDEQEYDEDHWGSTSYSDDVEEMFQSLQEELESSSDE